MVTTLLQDVFLYYLDFVDAVLYMPLVILNSKNQFDGKDKIVMMIKCSADYEDARYVLLCKVNEQ